jgi:microcystin-dependent protein
MADPFVAEIRIFGFNFAPRGWAFCDGQLLPLSQNTALFSLLGTTYGGNGKTNFALPNLQGRAPMHHGQGPGLSLRDLGESAGSPDVTLTASQVPSHTHALQGTGTAATTDDPAGAWPATVARGSLYGPAQNLVTLAPQAVASSGGDLPHNNMQPHLTLNFCIAVQGVFPQRP